MGCNHTEKEFLLKTSTSEFRLLGLDDCVFCTLISFPENDEDIAEMMWEQLNIYNSIDESEKEILSPVLMEFYKENKDNYSTVQTNCTDCSSCG